MAQQEESKNKPGEVMHVCDMYVEAALPNVWFLSLREGKRTSLWGKLIVEELERQHGLLCRVSPQCRVSEHEQERERA